MSQLICYVPVVGPEHVGDTVMTATFDATTKARLKAAYARQSTSDEFLGLRQDAAARGFRLAEPWEREMLDNDQLYSWRGTIWVRIERKK